MKSFVVQVLDANDVENKKLKTCIKIVWILADSIDSVAKSAEPMCISAVLLVVISCRTLAAFL